MMIKIDCPLFNCSAKPNIDLAKITWKEVQTKCPSCKNDFTIFHLLTKSDQQIVLNTIKSHDKKRESQSSFGYILVKDVNGEAIRYNLNKQKEEIGRMANTSTSSLQIKTDDRKMSRQHFFLEYVNGRIPYFRISKSNDKNGTYVETHNTILLQKEIRELENNEVARIYDEEIVIAGVTEIIVKINDSFEDYKMFQQGLKDNGFPKTVFVGKM